MAETPLVRLDRLASAAGVEGTIIAKLEYLLPGLSKKDRAARGIIENARADGSLAPGQAVVELTSGNMGTGLAIVCGVLGHPFVAVMSRGNSEERARMMRALGAEVVLVDQAPGGQPGAVSGADLALVEARAQEITAARGAFRADQFHRDGNWRAHHRWTGPELWRQSGRRIDAFVDFVGSGGSLAGVGRYLREVDPAIALYAAEPEGAAVLSGKAATDPSHPIQGGGYAIADLPFLEDLALTGHITVSGTAARDAARALARTEGVFGGYSAGANVAAALELLRGPHKGGTIAVLICDSGLKYLSTDLWQDATG